jgi:hypothetical protein
MGNEQTKAQIKRWLDNAVKEAKNPDPRKKIKRQREQKKTKVYKQYGL